MTDYFSKRPMLTSAIFCSALCIIGFYSRIFIFFAGLALIAAFFVLLYRRTSYKSAAVVFLMAATAVSILFNTGKIDRASELSGGTVTGSFIVLEDPEDHGSYRTAVLEVRECDGLERGMKIFTFSDEGNFECGDAVSAQIALKTIEDEYKTMNYSEKIYLTGSVKSITAEKRGADFVLAGISNVRKYIRSTLMSQLDRREASTLIALTAGDRSYFSDEFYSHIKSAGVSHVMVVSGMHLTVIVSMVLSISGMFFYNRFVKAFAVFFTVLFMMTLCGFTMSIVRAGISYLLFALSLVLERENTPENTLGAAVVLMLIISPFTIFSISFQLSVLSTLGIVAVALPVIKYVEDREIIKSRLILLFFSATVISLSAMLFTMPVSINIFGYISGVSLITNLLISYAVTGALSVAAAGLAVNALLPFAAPPFFLAAGLLTKYLNHVIDKMGGLEFAVIETGSFSLMASLLLLSGIIVALFACKKKHDMLKLKQVQDKIVKEGGGRLIWR